MADKTIHERYRAGETLTAIEYAALAAAAGEVKQALRSLYNTGMSPEGRAMLLHLQARLTEDRQGYERGERFARMSPEEQQRELHRTVTPLIGGDVFGRATK